MKVVLVDTFSAHLFVVE